MKKLLAACCVLCVITGLAFADATLSVVTTQVPNGSTTATLPIALTNTDDLVAGVQFDVYVDPFLEVDSVRLAPRVAGLSLEYSYIPEGGLRILIYDPAGGNLPGTEGSIALLDFTVEGYVNSIFYFYLMHTIVSGPGGEMVPDEVENGTLRVGESVDLYVLPASGDAGTTGNLVQVGLNNPDGDVGGVQFDIFALPQVLTVESISTTDRTTGFEVQYTEMEDAVRVVLFSNSGAAISVGDGPILDFSVSVDVYANPGDVFIRMNNVVTGDPDGVEIATVAHEGIFEILHGYKFPPTNLVATSGLDGHIPLAWAPPEGGGVVPEELFEGFEEGIIPEDWTMTSNSEVGWFVTQDGSSEYFSIPPHTWYACSNDDAADDDGSMDYLVTPPINTSNADQLQLTFASFFTGEWSQTASVEVSTDGIAFTTVYDLPPYVEWVTETVDLSDYIGEETLYIAFHSNDNGEWASGWAVDDISVAFTSGRSVTNIHFGLSEVGEWLVSSTKSEVVARYPNGFSWTSRIDESNIFYETTPSSREENRSLFGYNIYRSEQPEVQITPENFVASVDSASLTFDDTSVENGVEYFYVVTADYGDFGESGPSNEVSAMAVRWVHLAVGLGQGDQGATGTVPVSMDNEQAVGGFEFTLRDIPNWLSFASAATTPRTSGWSVAGSEQSDGSCKILGYNLTGSTVAPGTGDIVTVTFNVDAGAPIGPVTIYLEDAVVSDASGDYSYPWESAPGEFGVGSPEVEFTMPDTSVTMMGEPMILDVEMTNTEPVSGFQFDLADPEDHLTAENITHTLNAAVWTVAFNELSNGDLRVLGYNLQGESIPANSSHLFSITFAYDDTAMTEGMHWMDFSATVASDPNGDGLYSMGYGGWMMMISNEAPQPFSLLEPANNTVWEIHENDTSAVEYTFSWEDAVDPDDDPVLYGVMFGAPDYGEIPFPIPSDNGGLNNSLTVSVSEIVDLLIEAGVPPTAGTYSGYWYVLATDGYEEVQSTETWNLSVSILVSVDEQLSGIPEKYSLSQNYPNPFNPETNIGFGLVKNDHVDMCVYNLLGQEIRTLINGNMPAGYHQVTWDGRDNSGNLVKSGVYIYRIQTEDFTRTRKMILMK